MGVTNTIRSAIFNQNLWGKRITFRYRFEKTEKLKKVSGKLKWFSHKPDVGFRFHLTQVRMLGHYFGPVEFYFLTGRVVWIRHNISDVFQLKSGENKEKIECQNC